MLFRPITMRGVTARNRIMLGPMSQYLSVDGNLTDWHLGHLGQYAIGGAGIVCSEETAVIARGRRTHHCAGIYTDEHVRGYCRITDFLKDMGAVPAIQLGHAGRRGSVRAPWEGRLPLGECDAAIGNPPWTIVSSSPIPMADRRRRSPWMRKKSRTKSGRGGTLRRVPPTQASTFWKFTARTAT